ncbi:hypothetical protein BLNAU_22270 [Blattamonas nauphoetae]|uniref:Uncharacterized protein n=1 Tax=Blattamonas nauphoetae TaxID=2049346 RepID=A0ABQ9WVS9_9EUKA|nr:hypothetical protein BLNAU_22270 [Blattamonas nauphoetae]
MTNKERNDLLHRFGAAISHLDNQEIDIESLAKLASLPLLSSPNSANHSSVQNFLSSLCLLPRSFTDPASPFFRLASTDPAFFSRLVKYTADILDIAISTAVSSVRVVTNTNMSTDAVSIFSNKFGLCTPQTQALLFATPPTFPVSDAFTPRHPEASESLYRVEVSLRRLVRNQWHHVHEKLGIPLAGCLVNALHSTMALHTHSPSSHQSCVDHNTNQPSCKQQRARRDGDFTQLVVVSRETPDIANELGKLKTKPKLSLLHIIRSTPRVALHLETNPDAFRRVVELVGHTDNAARQFVIPPDDEAPFQIELKPEMSEIVIRSLRMITSHRREGGKEGCVGGKDEMTS